MSIPEQAASPDEMLTNSATVLTEFGWLVTIRAMPSLTFSYKGKESVADMGKVDRSKLYGYSKTEVIGEDDKPCSLATLSNDGKTIIPSGGTALAYFSPDGMWRDKADLKPVNIDGDEITPVTSTLKAPVELSDTATVEEFLSHNIRLIYQLKADENGFNTALTKELDKGTIFKFGFSYRGGLTADAAFLLKGQDGTFWMLVGKPTTLEFIGFEQVGTVTQEDVSDSETEADIMSFDMM